MTGFPIAAAGHGWGLAIFPMIAALVSLVFAMVLLSQFVVGRRPFQGLWVLALLMYAVASFAMFLGVANGWSSGEFRTYWLFGAVLNVPYLAMGELYLLIRRRATTHVLLAALLAGSAFASWKVLGAPIHDLALAKALPLGKDVFGDASAPYRISQLYAFPAYFLLLGGIVWSAWQMRGRPEIRDRTTGIIVVALGATIVAIGSGVGAGFNVVPLFSVSLAAGIVVMFLGFLRAGRPHRGPVTPPGRVSRNPPSTSPD